MVKKYAHPEVMVTVLDDMIARLSTPGAWVQNSFAKDKDGEVISPVDEKATCFCTMGALSAATWAIYKGTSYEVYEDVKFLMERTLADRDDCPEHEPNIPMWNDHAERTPEQVVEFLNSVKENLK